MVVLAKFQSTLPAWGATLRRELLFVIKMFQSTLPAWGATGVFINLYLYVLFQSTLPAWGATRAFQLSFPGYSEFQSTLPAWGATSFHAAKVDLDFVSIHVPRMGSDLRLDTSHNAR